jgi:hypothetical protein
MRYIKVKCVNENCAESRVEPSTIPAGVMVAPGVMARQYNLECVACGQDVQIERV